MRNSNVLSALAAAGMLVLVGCGEQQTAGGNPASPKTGSAQQKKAARKVSFERVNRQIVEDHDVGQVILDFVVYGNPSEAALRKILTDQLEKAVQIREFSYHPHPTHITISLYASKADSEMARDGDEGGDPWLARLQRNPDTLEQGEIQIDAERLAAVADDTQPTPAK